MFLSTIESPQEMSTVNRKESDGSITQIQCPSIAKTYLANMGCVDKADMLRSLYTIDRKAKRSWLRLFWYFVDVSIVNSFILYTLSNTGRSLKLKEFRRKVVTGLVGTRNLQDTPGPSSNTPPPKRFKPQVTIVKRKSEAQHMPVHGPPKRCAHCSTKKVPHRSRWMCSSCNVALCLSSDRNCFTLYHN
ncbi:hypothetical protein C0J52_19114 [Blattella germanica]|nr:hypothetical protein C0J52_19114 [Blattella germanica]